jgi:hypothetical protein
MRAIWRYWSRRKRFGIGGGVADDINLLKNVVYQPASIKRASSLSGITQLNVGTFCNESTPPVAPVSANAANTDDVC